MRRTLTIAMTVALLMALMALPAVAKGPHAKATGTVEWTARGGALPGLVTSFSVHDEAPGMNGDRGFWTLSNNDVGSYTVDVVCVNVDGNEAWFAGIVTDGDGIYEDRPGAVQLFWVKDGATPGSGGDLLGGAGPDRLGDINQTCARVEAGNWTGSGAVDSGNLKTHPVRN